MAKTHFTRRKIGFTITELIMVVVIIGVLAAIAIPSYRIQMLKMKNQEAIRILMTLWEAQRDYLRENGSYATDVGQLPIDIPSPKYFYGLSTWPSVYWCTGPNEMKVVSLNSNSPAYRLFALADGRIVCKPIGAGPCPGSLCKRMGFPDW